MHIQLPQWTGKGNLSWSRFHCYDSFDGSFGTFSTTAPSTTDSRCRVRQAYNTVILLNWILHQDGWDGIFATGENKSTSNSCLARTYVPCAVWYSTYRRWAFSIIFIINSPMWSKLNLRNFYTIIFVAALVNNPCENLEKQCKRAKFILTKK